MSLLRSCLDGAVSDVSETGVKGGKEMWDEELERNAANGKAMPDGLKAPERALYVAMRGLYYQFQQGIVDQQQAKREKAALMKDYRQVLLDEKCREKSARLWRELPHDIMKSDCPKCQAIGKVIYGLR